MSDDLRGKPKYQRKQSVRRLARVDMPGSVRDYTSIPHPRGHGWSNRVRSVFGDGTPLCWLCGEFIPRGSGAADHIIPLTEGQGLSISTDDLNHPLNQRANLAPAHQLCNSYRGQLSPVTGRRKVAERLGMPAPYSGPVPDVSGVRAELSRLADQSAHVPLTAPTSSRYRTIAEACHDLTNADGTFASSDLDDIWSMAGSLACPCGPADGSRCWICLPDESLAR